MTERGDWRDRGPTSETMRARVERWLEMIERATAEEWCNGCGTPRREWSPVCPGMTTGDATHYHSATFWARGNAISARL